MAMQNRLLGAPKKLTPKPLVRYAWPVVRDGRSLGKVVVFEERSSCFEVNPYDAVTAAGERLGGFETRADAAMALGAEAVAR